MKTLRWKRLLGLCLLLTISGGTARADMPRINFEVLQPGEGDRLTLTLDDLAATLPVARSQWSAPSFSKYRGQSNDLIISASIKTTGKPERTVESINHSFQNVAQAAGEYTSWTDYINKSLKTSADWHRDGRRIYSFKGP